MLSVVDLDITQAIYHRSRDAELAGIGWTTDDLDKMRQLSALGIELSITGGIVPEDIYLFEGIKTKTFIAGRALAGAEASKLRRLCVSRSTVSGHNRRPHVPTFTAPPRWLI